jgi:hypothetical protein
MCRSEAKYRSSIRVSLNLVILELCQLWRSVGHEEADGCLCVGWWPSSETTNIGETWDFEWGESDSDVPPGKIV